MSGNTFGTIFQATTFGESHGAAVGVILCGVPAGLPIDTEFIQSELDRRRPGAGIPGTTPRKEADRVNILSGVFEGVATGTPIAMMIENTNTRSGDYSLLKDTFRPGHADYTYFKKYGTRDWRGGGRSSARETAARVCAGAVAKLFLKENGIIVQAGVEAIGGVKAAQIDYDAPNCNELNALDSGAVPAMKEALTAAAMKHDSLGGVVRCRILNAPAGLGEPVFDKIDALLAHAILSIGAVKGIEFGEGFAASELSGSENNDAITANGFAGNRAGGVLGGISNGDEIYFRAAVKPTPSIGVKQRSINTSGEECEIEIGGRHDVCVVPRVVPVVEAMAALVIADMLLIQRTRRL